MSETPKLWPHAWSLIRGQQRAALVGLVLTLFSIAASLSMARATMSRGASDFKG